MIPIRILIIDDHEVVRLGLRTLLQGETDMEVVAEAGTAKEALGLVESYAPDVVILDIQLPDRNGLDICREIRQRYSLTQVVMLTSSVNENFILDAIRAGAVGYVLKQVGNDELMRAIRAAKKGELALDPKTSARVINQLNDLHRKSELNAFKEISPREMDVLALVARGLSNKEIGQLLNLSEITVRNYVGNMLEKLQVRNRIELATFAVLNRINDHLRDK